MTRAIGTTYWIAPEILKNQEYDDKADVYRYFVTLIKISYCIMLYFYLFISLALVLWEVISKEIPYAKYNFGQHYFAVCDKDERPPIPSRCSETVTALLTNW